MIDVLCADKTGTLTENSLSVAAVCAVCDGYGEDDILGLALLASSVEGQDLVDRAVCAFAARRHIPLPALTVRRFTPFDPARKLAEAITTDANGQALRIVKGAPLAVTESAPTSPRAAKELGRFTAAGYRALAVACGPADAMTLIGLIALSDPPRADSRALLAELRSLGVRPIMVSGDAAATVAGAIGLDGPVCPPGKIPDDVSAAQFAVYAGVFPEDKFRLVKAFQRHGDAVGMCGDGANDAPALRQAQVSR